MLTKTETLNLFVDILFSEGFLTIYSMLMQNLRYIASLLINQNGYVASEIQIQLDLRGALYKPSESDI